MKTASAHLPRVVGYATVAAMLPYLAIKTAWILGSEIGVAEPGLMRTTPFVVGNLLTAGMELAGAGLALALVHRWGQRTPTWLLLFPMWVASGLLAPVMLAAPLGFLAESLTGMGATGGLDAGDGPASGLQGWVYAVVYTGFTLQGAGLAVAFALHLRTRWSSILTAYLDPAASVDATGSTDPGRLRPRRRLGDAGCDTRRTGHGDRCRRRPHRARRGNTPVLGCRRRGRSAQHV